MLFHRAGRDCLRAQADRRDRRFIKALPPRSETSPGKGSVRIMDRDERMAVHFIFNRGWPARCGPEKGEQEDKNDRKIDDDECGIGFAHAECVRLLLGHGCLTGVHANISPRRRTLLYIRALFTSHVRFFENPCGSAAQ